MKSGKRVPRHVAIIMDGNGRWAKRRGLRPIDGHREGAKAVRRTIEAAHKFGLEFLTLYAFSTENWNRPRDEVSGLMTLLREFIDENLEEIHKKGIRLKTIGKLDRIPAQTRKRIQRAVQMTESNTAGTAILALNYGSRTEIADAARALSKDAISGKINVRDIEENLFSRYLYDPSVPDPDLLIRTSGECRLSNFLLWQSAYTEFFFVDVLWPDFAESDFAEAIETYGKRERRFGERKSS
jgi:undecaprenyl diphosphate synthase